MLDSIQHFQFTDLPVRGGFIRLNESWQQVRQRAEPTGSSESVLGELLAATGLIRNGLKDSERFYAEFTGGDYIKSMIADAQANGNVRGLAVVDEQFALSTENPLQNTRLLLAVEKQGKQYQSIIEVIDDDLTATLQHYFKQSEQISTIFVLAANRNECAGFMLQVLPGDIQEDDWVRISLLCETLSKEELLVTDNQSVLRRLFNEDTIRLFDAESIEFQCTCTNERAYNAIINLGVDEVSDILDSEQVITVTCEFCGQCYIYRREDLSVAYPELLNERPTQVH